MIPSADDNTRLLRLSAGEAECLSVSLSKDQHGSSKAKALNPQAKALSLVTSVLIYDSPLNPILPIFSCSIFSSIQELHVESVPPSTIRDLFTLRVQLKKLEIVNSGITSCQPVFIPVDKKHFEHLTPYVMPISAAADMEIPVSVTPNVRYLWRQLRSLRLVNCGIATLDASFQFMPSLQHLDVSHNDISELKNLHHCSSLSTLVASHNKITSIHLLRRVLGNVTALDLSHNRIGCIRGLESLVSLERLDISHNRLTDSSEGMKRII